MLVRTIIFLVILCLPGLGWAGVNCDGLDDVVTLANESVADCANTSCTISFWYQTSVANFRYLVSKSGPGTGWHTHILSSGGTIGGRIRDFAGQIVTQRNSTTVVNTNTWRHVAVVLTTNTAATAGNSVLLYLDGVVHTGTTSAGSNGMAVNNNPVVLCYTSTSDTYTIALLENVAIYAGALTAQQIAILAQARMYNPPITATPIALLPMDTCTSGQGLNLATLPDRSGNAAHGTGDDGVNNSGMICARHGGLMQPRGVE